MDYFENPSNLKLLQNLLKEPDDNSSDSEPDDRVPTFPKAVKPSKPLFQEEKSTNQCEENPSSSKVVESNEKLRKPFQNLPQTLEEWEDQETRLNADEIEHRLIPEYRIVYKQSVTPEDIYLQMTNKTPATASCEEMCVEIQMPLETVSIDRMQLDVTPDEIDLQTPVYRLKLPLVQQIDPDRGKASWDDKEKLLRLTVRMKREYDFINF